MRIDHSHTKHASAPRMPYLRPGTASSRPATPTTGGGNARPRRTSGAGRGVVLMLLLAAVAVSMGSCRRAVEKARRNIRFEGIERVERVGLTGAEVVVRVKNDTGYKLELQSAQIDIYYAEGLVGSVVLREPVEVPRHTTESFRTLWQLKISDPLALYVLAKKVQSADLSQIGVAYAAEGRGGPAPVKISHPRMPLSDFLNIFGLTIQDVKNYLK